MEDQEGTGDRLQSLHELKGRDLVSALIKELGELHHQVQQLQREMSAYREYQAARDRWLVIDTVQKTRVQLPKSVTIDASQLLPPRQGFYGLEYGGKGTPFCWTGPSPNFSFDIFVDRSRGAELELRALSCINFERQKNIKLLVNGESIPAEVTRNGHGLVVKAPIPASDDDRVSNIVFCLPEALKPAAEADKRLLGIAFQSLTVRARGETEAAPQAKRAGDTVVSLPRAGAVKRPDEAPASGPVVAVGDAS